MAIEINGIIHTGKLETKWTVWKRTICVLPRKDITGIYIMGLVWHRVQEARVYNFQDDVGYYLSQNLGYIEYAQSKKDIFLRSLNGEEK